MLTAEILKPLAGLSSWEVAKRLNLSQSCVYRAMRKFGLPLQSPKSSRKKFCQNCEQQISSNNHKFCGHKCHAEFELKLWTKSWLARTLPKDQETSQRTKLALIQLHGNRCQNCGWCEVNPTTGKIPVQLEHKDGDFQNNHPDNVSLLCPNCHSLTPTFGALNRGNGRWSRTGMHLVTVRDSGSPGGTRTPDVTCL